MPAELATNSSLWLLQACNLLLVRGCCKLAAAGGRDQGGWARWLTRKKSGKVGWINDDLKAGGWQPAKVVALVRLPFLWGGFFNYFFSLSDVAPAKYFVARRIWY